MKCFRCDKTAPLFRLYCINPSGRVPVWVCNQHRFEPDEELDAARGVGASTGSGK